MALAPIGAAAPAAPAAPGAPSGRSFADVLQSRGGLCAAPAAPAPAAIPTVLGAIERARARLDAVLAAARSGRTFTAQELIGLQAEAYRTVQTVDLATKLVEQGSQSVKQAWNTQL
jgi:hypothetical protein